VGWGKGNIISGGVFCFAKYALQTRRKKRRRKRGRGGRKIRYEKKSSISVDCFVLQHHPNNVHHLTAEADERLALGFAL